MLLVYLPCTLFIQHVPLMPYLTLSSFSVLCNILNFFQGGFTGVGRFSGYQSNALSDVGVLIWIMRSSAKKLHVVS